MGPENYNENANNWLETMIEISPESLQKSLLDKAINGAGPRYTPDSHVDLPIAEMFNGLGRTSDFWSKLDQLIRKMVCGLWKQ